MISDVCVTGECAFVHSLIVRFFTTGQDPVPMVITLWENLDWSKMDWGEKWLTHFYLMLKLYLAGALINFVIMVNCHARAKNQKGTKVLC